jgi:hypothetical protein
LSNDDKSNKKKSTDDYMAGLSGSEDSYTKMPSGKPIQKIARFNIADKQEAPKDKVDTEIKEVKREVKPVVVEPKIPERKPEPPKIVVPKFIKKDSELEKDIIKVIQEVPREELERLLKPNRASKDRLAQMDFQTREDMSEEEKKDFIDQIVKREPEPEIAEMNGALVWKWQKNRRIQAKKDIKGESK